MKIYSTVFLVIFSTNLLVQASTIEIQDPCVDRVAFHGFSNVRGSDAKSLGEVSVDVFTKNNIQFIGTADGINSIFGTPTGDESLVSTLR